MRLSEVWLLAFTAQISVQLPAVQHHYIEICCV